MGMGAEQEKREEHPSFDLVMFVYLYIVMLIYFISVCVSLCMCCVPSLLLLPYSIMLILMLC